MRSFRCAGLTRFGNPPPRYFPRIHFMAKWPGSGERCDVIEDLSRLLVPRDFAPESYATKKADARTGQGASQGAAPPTAALAEDRSTTPLGARTPAPDPPARDHASRRAARTRGSA